MKGRNNSLGNPREAADREFPPGYTREGRDFTIIRNTDGHAIGKIGEAGANAHNPSAEPDMMRADYGGHNPYDEAPELEM